MYGPTEPCEVVFYKIVIVMIIGPRPIDECCFFSYLISIVDVSDKDEVIEISTVNYSFITTTVELLAVEKIRRYRYIKLC